MVQRVEGLGADVRTEPFGEFRLLDHGNIQVADAVGANAGKAERLVAHIIHQLICHIAIETSGVEPCLGRPLADGQRDRVRVAIEDEITEAERIARLMLIDGLDLPAADQSPHKARMSSTKGSPRAKGQFVDTIDRHAVGTVVGRYNAAGPQITRVEKLYSFHVLRPRPRAHDRESFRHPALHLRLQRVIPVETGVSDDGEACELRIGQQQLRQRYGRCCETGARQQWIERVGHGLRELINRRLIANQQRTYLRAIGVPVLKGRWPAEGSLFGVVVNQAFARQAVGGCGGPEGQWLHPERRDRSPKAQFLWAWHSLFAHRTILHEIVSF